MIETSSEARIMKCPPETAIRCRMPDARKFWVRRAAYAGSTAGLPREPPDPGRAWLPRMPMVNPGTRIRPWSSSLLVCSRKAFCIRAINRLQGPGGLTCCKPSSTVSQGIGRPYVGGAKRPRARYCPPCCNRHDRLRAKSTIRSSEGMRTPAKVTHCSFNSA